MNSEQIEEIASRWFGKQLSGTWTESDQAELDAWLESAIVNRVAYIRLTATWNRLARMTVLRDGKTPESIPARGSWGDAYFSKIGAPDTDPRPDHSDDLHESGHEEPPISERTSPPVTAVYRRRANRRLFVAAAVLFAIVGGAYPHLVAILNGNEYSTPVGGLEIVQLLDGSKVTLNTDTKLRAVMTKGQRRIDLERGEAFFDVAHDSSRPFVVYAGNKRVMAVGTQFSVRRDNDDVQVVVTEGRVSLATSEIATLQAPNAGSETHPDILSAATTTPPVTMLPAGTVARTVKTDVLVEKEAVSEGEALLSWRNGYVSFRDVTLAAAVEEFNRYNTRKIVVDDPAIAKIRIGGSFRDNNTDAFLWLLQSGFPIRVVQDQNKIVLSAR